MSFFYAQAGEETILAAACALFPPEQNDGVTVYVNTAMTQELHAGRSLNIILDGGVRNECHVGDIMGRCGDCTVHCHSRNKWKSGRKQTN